MAREPFVWGAGGQQLTPQQVEERRKVAQAIMGKGMDFSPAGHWTESLGRAFNGWYGGREAGRANRYEEDATAAARSKMEGRYGAVAKALMGNEAAPQQVGYTMGQDAGQPLYAGRTTPDGMSMGASAASPDSIRAGLIARGLPEHVADGFIMNFQDESGMNPGINEISPLTPGSRGGFGLYQLTGPRRTAYEAFAADRGVDPSDVDAQLDWLMHELQGPEAKAAKSIFSAGSAGEAGAAIVNNFLRPSQEHRQSRASRYLGTPAGASPYTATAPQGSGSAEIAALLADPWVKDQYGDVLGAEMQQAQAREMALFEEQRRQQDPMYMAQLEAAQLANAAAKQPQQVKPIEINGQLVNPLTLEVMGDYRDSNNEGFNPERYRVVGNTLFDLGAEGGPAPVADGTGTEEVIFGPDGQPIMVRGSAGAAKSFTEAQSKDVGFSTRMRGAEEELAPIENALTSFGDRLLNADPTGLLRGNLQSEEFQKAQQASKTWLLAFLRKDSGAATTKEEDALYGETFLPQPGDGEGVISQKRQMRDLAMRAVEAGMSPTQALAQARALGNAGGQHALPQPQQSQVQPAQPKSKTEFDALPSGATFIAPDGTMRRKP